MPRVLSIKTKWLSLRTGLVGGALLVAAFAGSFLFWAHDPDDALLSQFSVRPVSRPIPQSAAPMPSVTGTTSHRDHPDVERPTHCPYQTIEFITRGSTVERACVSPTKLVRNGNVRTYIVEPQGTSRWSLRLDTDAHSVMRAVWSSSAQAYRCSESCSGVSFGPRDTHGVRVLEVSGLTLMADSDERNAAGPRETVTLRATLRVRSDAEDPSLACAGASVAVVESTGANFRFCASDGTGVAHPEDGRQRFEMRHSEGDVLSVELDQTGAIERVQMGDFSCLGDSCSGSTTQEDAPLDSGTSRSFDFSGVTLFTDDKRRSATLNGSVIVPTS